MSGVPNRRRPPLVASRSAPDVFSRPMDPGPAPLVYINGSHGVGKETVAECLTLLLGRDKSLLIDVRSVGRETASGGNNCYGDSRRMSRHKRRRRDEHCPPLLTPEHPRYHSFDLDPDGDVLCPLPSSPSSSCCFSSAPSVYSSATSRSGSVSSDSTFATPLPPASAARPAIKTSGTSPVSITVADLIPASAAVVPHSDNPASPRPAVSPRTATRSLNTVPIFSSSPSSSANIPLLPSSPLTSETASLPAEEAADAVPAPCSSRNLAALLASPANRRRIAILPACAPDTPAGQAALRTFEAAAARAHRPFVSVVLRCGEDPPPPLPPPPRSRPRPSSGTARGGYGGGGLGILGGGLPDWLPPLPLPEGEAASGSGGQRTGSDDRAKTRSWSSPGPGPGPGVAAEKVEEEECCWAQHRHALGPARPAGPRWTLTVDVTCAPAFEAALQIVEFVKGLEAEREAELSKEEGGGGGGDDDDGDGDEGFVRPAE
ncbi:hypothetical protein VTH06DRAFT_871 [Thermothelomyces fergusii]